MKKLILTAVFTAICFMTSAQVGVGTTNPETTLHVVGANATGLTNTPGALNAVDGITVPVVTDDMTTTTTNGTKVSQLVYSNNAASTGFYFWSGTAWVAMTPSAAPNFGSEQEINVSVPSQLDISASNSNHFKITGGALFDSHQLTMPTPSANRGRIIVIDNATNQSTVSWANNVGGVPLINAERTVLVFCNGVGWSMVTQD